MVSVGGLGPSVTQEVGQRRPLEWWERLLVRWQQKKQAWERRHPVSAARWRTVRNVMQWVSLAVLVVAVVMSETYRKSVLVVLAAVVLLIWWFALTRTRTLSWRATCLLFTISLAWAPVIGLITIFLSVSLYFPGWEGNEITAAGPATAIAGFGEESLKLLPLAVWALLAPGRVRCFAATDWLLAGFVCGLGFQVIEEFVRRIAAEVLPKGILGVALDILFDGEMPGMPQYGWGPLGGGHSQTGLVEAAFAGHHIVTGIVGACIGLAVAYARSTTTRYRFLVALLPILSLGAVALDHFGFNATSSDPYWVFPPEDRDSSVPLVMRGTWVLLGQGYGRGWILLVLLVLLIVLDAQVLKRVRTERAPSGSPVQSPPRKNPCPNQPWAGPVAASRRAVCEAAVVVAADLRAVVQAHRRRTTSAGELEPRAQAATRGMATAVLIRQQRLEDYYIIAQRASAGPARVRVTAVAALVGIALVAGLLAPALATQLGVQLTEPSAWLAGQLEVVEDWWGRLSPSQRWGLAVVIAALGGLLIGGLSGAMVGASIADLAVKNPGGLKQLAQDPWGTARSYFSSHSPGEAAVGATSLAMTFNPTLRGLKVAEEGMSATRKTATQTFETNTRKSIPEWLEQRLLEGRQFNKENHHRYPVNELRVKPLWQMGDDADRRKYWSRMQIFGEYTHLDSYVPGKEIVSRKDSQLAEIQLQSVKNILNEILKKYPQGAPIEPGKGNFNHAYLKGDKLKGEYFIEIPVQKVDIPDEVSEIANLRGIFIRDVEGRIYNK